jgi:putative SOS response-associated peptidase YedK
VTLVDFCGWTAEIAIMCGRFALNALPEDVLRLFELDEIEDFPPRYNIAPTQPILLIEPSAGEGHNRAKRVASLARWGLIPSWVKDVKAFPLLISARAESVAEKASFRAALRHRRVLVPASGYYEWRRTGTAKSQPFWIRPRNGGLIALAGLKEPYLSPDGSELDTAALITMESKGHIAQIHDRMPVVIAPQDFDRWLNCRDFEPREVADLLARGSDQFEAIPVSEKVNKVANSGPEIQIAVNLNDSADEPETKPARTSAQSPQMKLF